MGEIEASARMVHWYPDKGSGAALDSVMYKNGELTLFFLDLGRASDFCIDCDRNHALLGLAPGTRKKPIQTDDDTIEQYSILFEGWEIPDLGKFLLSLERYGLDNAREFKLAVERHIKDNELNLDRPSEPPPFGD